MSTACSDHILLGDLCLLCVIGGYLILRNASMDNLSYIGRHLLLLFKSLFGIAELELLPVSRWLTASGIRNIGVLVRGVISSRVNLEQILGSGIVGRSACMRHLPAMSGALRPVVIDVLGRS